MSDTRDRAAVLGALLCDPTSKLNVECKLLGLDDAWEHLLRGGPNVPEPLRERLRNTDASAFARRGIDAGGRIVVPGDPDWPGVLDDLGLLAPWALWVRGNAPMTVFDARAVAIVGARACTSYGRDVASEFAHGIASAGTAVVSGGAYGIDAAAHRGALAAEGVTVAVLSCGIDMAYPAEHTALLERITERGLIVTEAAPGSHPTKPSFLVRNRLIAALAYGTVVVEARLRSGSISTYAHARALHRLLMAVPGPVTAAESAGTNLLLQQDAQLVTNAREVLGLVKPLGSVALEDPVAPSSEWDTLTREQQHVYECLPARRALRVDQLQGQAPLFLSGMALMAALAGLAARELVTELDDGTWRRARPLRGVAA